MLKYKPAQYKITSWKNKFIRSRKLEEFKEIVKLFDLEPKDCLEKINEIYIKSCKSDKENKRLWSTPRTEALEEMVESLNSFIWLEETKNICGRRNRKSES